MSDELPMALRGIDGHPMVAVLYGCGMVSLPYLIVWSVSSSACKHMYCEVFADTCAVELQFLRL